MIGHTIDRCFELAGIPLGFKKGNVGQNSSNNDNKTNHSKSAPHTLTNDEYQRLMALLSDTSNASKSHASVAGLDTLLTKFLGLSNVFQDADAVIVGLLQEVLQLPRQST
ncbi:hypothetical protein Tco_0586321 [Tanacetum coccineum]